MTRVPVFATIVVGIAVAAMIGLGLWQLERRGEKEAYLAQIAGNPAKPAITFPALPDQSLLLRRATSVCLEPLSIKSQGAGGDGYRLIAECRTGAEGPGMLVQLGTTRDPNAKVAWRGGAVNGFIGAAPDPRSLIGKLFDHAPQRQMLVLDTPVTGLSPNRPPDLSSIPNNHFAYAWQWFLFAGIAALIYGLALRRRTLSKS